LAILNPEHLLDQASRLISAPVAGRPRQVDVRRSISSAYYAIFHAVITAAADEFVGAVHRSTREHGLVMRSVDHRTIKTICIDLTKTQLPRAYRSYVPPAGFADDITAFADVFSDLQEQRHAADYDSLKSYVTADAQGAIANARTALGKLRHAPASDRRAFLFLLLFPPKR